MPAAKPLFAFTLSTLAPDTFHVVRFTGEEGLSTLYRFEITLISQDQAVDFDAALQGDARFSIASADAPERVWHGVLSDFRQTQRVGGHSFYTAVLVPRAYRLTLSRHSRIFLNQDIPATLAECLKAARFEQGGDFEVVTSRSYPRRDYVCQYNETPFHFLSRWMERNGLYFFFDQSQGRDRLVLTETLTAHPPLPGSELLVHTEPSGLEAPLTGSAVHGFRGHKRRLPKDVLLRDYNYRTPNLEITAKAQVCKNGEGTVYVHGGGIRNLTEARLLAHARAQELACRGLVLSGESNAPQLAPGYLFTLSNHYRDDFNQRYLATLARHEGSQESWLTAGIATRGLGEGLFYRNAFTAIPADVQYRSECKADWPSIAGTMSAFIDAEGSGDTPELDQHGRYKVVLPFDISGRGAGKATAWIRMAQPYAGEGCGMHFPLRKGTEVLVGFIHGDPDMPVIQAAVPNPVTPSPVTGDNQTMAAITSASGNHFHMEDKPGGQYLHLSSPVQGSSFTLGSPVALDQTSQGFSQQDSDELSTLWSNYNETDYVSTGGVQLTTNGILNIKAATANSVILGENTQWNFGGYSCNTIGLCATMNVGASETLNVGVHGDFAPYWREIHVTKARLHERETAAATNFETMAGESIFIGEIDQKVTKNSTEIHKTKITLSSTIGRLVNDEKTIKNTVNAIQNTKTTITNQYTEAIAAATSVLATRQQMTDVNRKIGNMEEEIATTIITMAEKHDALVTETVALEETRTHLTLNFDIA